MEDDLAEFLIKACDSDRSKRFETAAQMLTALREVRASL